MPCLERIDGLRVAVLTDGRRRRKTFLLAFIDDATRVIPLPRLINRTAHYALTAAAAQGARTVCAVHIEHAVAELRL